MEPKLEREQMYLACKRFIDIFIAVAALLVLFPFLIILSLIIFVSSGRPVLFTQERVGRNWKPFRIYKFRTMVKHAETLGPQVCSLNDNRVTAIGRFLRKYKLDELPQFINVIKGEMSIVGPRPEVKEYADVYRNDYSRILKIKPGISDYASIHYRDEASMLQPVINPEDHYKRSIMPQKIELYHKYMNEMSFITDLKIIYATVKVLVK